MAMGAIDDFGKTSRSAFDERAFLAFVDAIPADRRWEPIEGIPIQTPPATLRHTRIATNLERVLNSSLPSKADRGEASRESGLRHPTDPEFRPIADLYARTDLIGEGPR